MNGVMPKQDLDVRAVREILKGMRLPDEVEQVEVRFGEDSTGDPGLYITFLLKAGLQLTAADVKRLTRFTTEATQELLSAGTNSFPYIELQQAS